LARVAHPQPRSGPRGGTGAEPRGGRSCRRAGIQPHGRTARPACGAGARLNASWKREPLIWQWVFLLDRPLIPPASPAWAVHTASPEPQLKKRPGLCLLRLGRRPRKQHSVICVTHGGRVPIYSDPRKKLVNSGWRHALALARIRFGGIRGAGCQHRHCDVARVGHLIERPPHA
jgi:hypothetical protein